MKVNRHGHAKVLTQQEIQQIFAIGLTNDRDGYARRRHRTTQGQDQSVSVKNWINGSVVMILDAIANHTSPPITAIAPTPRHRDCTQNNYIYAPKRL
ncbi:MAG: hypothetical protein V7K38_14150 [Nostoc sp.]|uniref:hypothetical protein n=1 Tax=Nostoc sp. TaxID=1180 RepID=UPI002FF5395B